MLGVWEVKMFALLCLLLATGCVLADKNDNRRNKLPFVADAVGNSLPPPSNVPATVGSPVNLLTPDRYEFYTFDESGELVKRLMTLEEIQAIVAAGEETEGLVTFANDNQPTVSFNINQPPYTKVHSVVTNVQNVLKAQMEAHKNKPQIQPTLDTPDVSDSWSLILPSIFGNTGVDIVFDKSTASISTPETETLENHSEDEENSLSKEGNDKEISSSTTLGEEKVTITEKIPTKATTKEVPSTTSTTSTTTTTTTTPRPTTTTHKPTTTTRKPPTTTRKSTTTTRKSITSTQKSTISTKTATNTTTATRKPVTSTSSTKKPTTAISPTNPSTAAIIALTKITTNPRTTTTTFKPTTAKPTTTTVTITTVKPKVTTKEHSVNDTHIREPVEIKVQVQTNSNDVLTTEKYEIEFEKISTFIPVSTINYVAERTTRKPFETTKSPIVYTSTTEKSIATTPIELTTEPPKIQTFATTSKPIISTSTDYISSTLKDQENEKMNVTTITTQSVSPSTTVSSTELISADNLNKIENTPNVDENNENMKYGEPLMPLFDVAQSISQIASDLGGSYQPIPTASNLIDTTQVNVLDLESKEVLDMDMPSGTGNETDLKTHDASANNTDNFIKISTLDPHDKGEKEDNEQKQTIIKESSVIIDTNDTELQKTEIRDTDLMETTTEDNISNVIINNIKTTTTDSDATTIDPILSESMGDLLSQVVNEAPQSIIDSEKTPVEDTKISTTEKSVETTTIEAVKITEITYETLSNKVKKETSSTTSIPVENSDEKGNVKGTTLKSDFNSTPEPNYSNVTEFIDEQKNLVTTEKPNNAKININSKLDEVEHNDQNFVQISVSTNKNEPKVESVFSGNKNNDTSTENKYNFKNNVDKPPKKEIIENENKTVETDMKIIPSVEIITTSPDSDIRTTTLSANRLTQYKYNNVYSTDKSNKKDKLTEPLPKVDDFKKKIQKINIDEEELISERNNSWKLVPTLSPPKANEIPKDKVKSENHYTPDNNDYKDIVLEFSNENQGLEVTTRDLGEDIARFSELSNELAFRFWNVMIDDIDKKRSFVLSPYSIFSMLAMIFMGARGATSGEMNEILKLDDMVTFNPHFTLKNISDSIETTPESGVAVSAFIRELYSDRNKGKILTFYKERAQQFYSGHVEEINFKLISDIIRRRTNLLVKRYTWGKIPEYMKTNNIVMQPPLAAFTANIFETDCSGTSVDGRDGEMYFVVSPNVRQRRLVPVPAVVYKNGFLAGYDPVLDATAAALGNTNTIVSTLFLMPGQQGNVVHADDLEKLEQRLLETLPTTPTWNRVLRTLLPRNGLELQIPRFSHKSTFNVSLSLKKMGLKDLFDGDHADLGGLNGPSKDLYLSDMVQLNSFATCGEGVVGEQHHIEEYPETLSVSQRRRTRWLNDWDEPRDYQRAFHDPHDVGDAMHLPLHLRPRQARLPARSALPARLKFDRPFLYFVRHNPSGMILYFGRYNPRLLP